jgi:hypothetical protein
MNDFQNVVRVTLLALISLKYIIDTSIDLGMQNYLQPAGGLTGKVKVQIDLTVPGHVYSLAMQTQQLISCTSIIAARLWMAPATHFRSVFLF